MTHLLRPLAVAVAIAMSACATSDSVAPASGTPTGMVIGSITHESSVGRYGLGIAGNPGQRIELPSVGVGMWNPFNKEMDEDLKERGGTYAMDLPAGQYRIFGWFVLRASTHYRSAQPSEIHFTVEAGKATYLGNLHFDQHWENVSLRDRSSRDMPILVKRFPKLASLEVAHSISPGANVERLGGGYTGQNQMPLYVPAPVRR